MTHSEEVPHRAAATQWGVAATIFGAAVVTVMQLGKPAPALPFIVDDMAIDMVTAGWVSSIINLFGALAGGIIGLLADRVGHRRAVVFGLLCLIGGGFLATITPSVSLLLAARFLEGVGLVVMFVAGTPLVIAASAADDRRLVLGIWSAFFPLGLGLIIAISAGFLAPLGWRNFFGANTALSILTLVVFIVVVRPSRIAEAAPSSFQGARRTLARPGPWLLAAMFLVMSISTFAVQTWLPTFLLEGLNLSIESAALAAAAFIFLFIPANIVGGRASGAGKIKRWHLLAIGSIGIVLVPFGIFADSMGDLSRAAIACLYPLTAGLIPGAVFGAIPIHASTESEIGVVSGLVTQGSFIGSLAGPPLLALLVLGFSGWSGAVWMFPVLGGCCLVIALAIGWVESPRSNWG